MSFATITRPCSVAAVSSQGQAQRAFRAAALRRPLAAAPRRSAVAAQAMMMEWTDPEFAAVTLENFPDKAIATAEEARCLMERGGYVYLDVRPSPELDAVGKVKGSVNVPIMNGTFKYNAELRKKELIKEDNPDFVRMVEKKFPNKEAKLIVADSDGRTYAIEALEALDEAGYTNMVGLKGGFYSWYRVFDNNGRRRRNGEYAEQYTHDGDSCGIHSSGAGFERVDSVEKWNPPSF